MSKKTLGFNALSNSGAISAGMDGRIVINSTIIDRMAGMSYSYEVFSGKVNTHYVVSRLVRGKTRGTVAEYFISRRLAAVVEEVVGMRTWKAGTRTEGRPALYAAILKSTSNNTDAADAIMEMTMPAFESLGIIGVNRPLHVRVVHPYAEVQFDDLLADFQRQVVMQAVSTAEKAATVPQGSTWATVALAEHIAEAFFSVGVELMSIMDFTVVARDIVRGVRAAVDPALTGLKGSVPSDVVRHEVVQRLSANVIFVKQALAIPAGDTMRIVSDAYKFEKWAPTILNMMRSSERYTFVSKDEYIQSIGVTLVRDSLKKPVRAVMWEAARFAPHAMTITATPDASVPGAISVAPSNERLGEHIEVSFGSLPDVMSTTSVVESYAMSLRHVVEEFTGTGSQLAAGLEVYSLSSHMSVETVALMLCDAIWFKRGTNGDEVVYRAKCDEQIGVPTSGSLINGELFTTDPVELIMFLGDREPVTFVEPKPQFISKQALRSSLVGTTSDDFISLSKRFSMSADILGMKIQGSLTANKLRSMEVDDIVCLVTPAYNREVSGLVMSVLEQYNSLGAVDGAQTAVLSRVRRNLAQYVIQCAEAVSPLFVSEVHEALIERSVAALDPKDSMKARSQLGQLAVARLGKVAGMTFFLGIQGLIDIFSAVKGGEKVGRPFDEGGSYVGRPLFMRMLESTDAVKVWTEI